MSNQLFAPEGWLNLAANIDYYLIANDPSSKFISLVHFDKSENAVLNQISRFDFEEGIRSKAIVRQIKPRSMPPWLSMFEGVHVAKNASRQSNKNNERLLTKMAHRKQVIKDAVNSINQILSSNDPLKELNKYARKHSPPQNETRFRNWVLIYLAFEKNDYALIPKFKNCGKWEREKNAKVKQGAPLLSKGKRYGYKMTKEMAEISRTAFAEYSTNGKNMVEIYVETLRKKFHCYVNKTPNDLTTTSKNPFPSFNQFKYAVDKHFGVRERQRILYGEARYRNKIAASKGRFSEEVAHLCEKIYADAHMIDERPKGFLHNSTMPPLYSVTSVDALSGMPLGVGFSFGGERNEGYKAMLFCMAISKKKFCSLFGIDIEDSEWPSQGLPPYLMIDRGPGAKNNLTEIVESKILIREIAPSWSGQSKATVETSHPKRIKLEGRPSHISSKLHPAQLAAAEILRILEYTSVTDVSDRIDPLREMIDVYPTPLGIWNHYDQFYRNECVHVEFEEAVRYFLTKVSFTVKEDGLYLQSRIFNSNELIASGVFENKEAKVEGYILEMCVRFAWVELNGQLIEVNAMLRTRADDDELLMSYQELKEFSESMSEKQSDLKLRKIASKIYTQERFEELTGHDFNNANERKVGRNKKTLVAQNESKKLFSGRNLKSA